MRVRKPVLQAFGVRGGLGASLAAADSLIWADLRGVDCLFMMRSWVKAATTYCGGNTVTLCLAYNQVICCVSETQAGLYSNQRWKSPLQPD